MKKFEAGKIYCEANSYGHGGCDLDSRIYVHSAGKMLVYSHITTDGKMWAFSESGKDRAKIQTWDESTERVHLPIGVCGTTYCAKYELPEGKSGVDYCKFCRGKDLHDTQDARKGFITVCNDCGKIQ